MTPARTSASAVLERAPARPSTDGLERFAWLMDRSFQVPGTNIRFGLDALIGLLPFGGDALMGVLQLGMVVVGVRRYKVPKAVAVRMLANVLLDMGVGAVPIVGDLFDVFFKANTRNLRLLQEAQAHERRGEKMPEGPSKRLLIGMLVAFLVLVVLLIAGLVILFLWLVRLLSGHPLI